MIQDKQVALRFESATLELLKARAKAQNRSFNNYILCLCLKDLNDARMYPRVELDEEENDDIRLMAGDGTRTPSEQDLMGDEKLRQIWER